MRKVLLGNSGVEVSIFCLGAMYFGTRNDKETSYQLLDQYVAAGGSFIDTANIYSRWVPGFVGGESEILLGEWMRERKNRNQLFLASKVGFEYPGVTRGLKARQIEEECHKSLKRMGIATIDLYYAHVDDRNTPMEETLAAFDRLVKAGKVEKMLDLSATTPAFLVLLAEGYVERISDSDAYYRRREGMVAFAMLSGLEDYARFAGEVLMRESPGFRERWSRAAQLSMR